MYISATAQFDAVTRDFNNRSPLAQSEVAVTLKVFREKYSSLASEIDDFCRKRSVNLDVKPSFMESTISLIKSEPSRNAPQQQQQQQQPQQSSPPPQQQQQQAPQQQQQQSTPSVVGTPFDVPDTEEFRKLIQEKQGVLLQNEHLQIGIIREYSNARVAMTLYYGNLGSEVLSNINVSVNNPDMNALTFDAERAPETLTAGQQIPQQVTAICAKEFMGAAQFNISYSLSNGRVVELKAHLPVITTSFTSAYAVSSQDFLAAWNQINGQPLEHQLVWKTKTTVDISRARNVFNTLQFSIIDGVDNSPNNLVASCVLNTSTQKVPALFRLETDANAQMFRITSKSFSPTLSASLSSLIKYFIS